MANAVRRVRSSQVVFCQHEVESVATRSLFRTVACSLLLPRRMPAATCCIRGPCHDGLASHVAGVVRAAIPFLPRLAHVPLSFLPSPCGPFPNPAALKELPIVRPQRAWNLHRRFDQQEEEEGRLARLPRRSWPCSFLSFETPDAAGQASRPRLHVPGFPEDQMEGPARGGNDRPRGVKVAALAASPGCGSRSGISLGPSGVPGQVKAVDRYHQPPVPLQ